MLEPEYGLAERAAPSCNPFSGLNSDGQLQRFYTDAHRHPSVQCLAEHAAYRYNWISTTLQKLWTTSIGPHLEPRFQGLTTNIDRPLLHYRPWQIILATAITLLLLITILDFIKGCFLGVQEKGKPFCEAGSFENDVDWIGSCT